MKIQRIVFAVMLLVAYPAIGDAQHAARCLARPRNRCNSSYRAANEARDPDVMYSNGLMFDRGEGVPGDYQRPSGGMRACRGRLVNQTP